MGKKKEAKRDKTRGSNPASNPLEREMVREGFYAFFYTGQAGSGTLMVCLKGGKLVGVDLMGGRITGTYTAADGGLVGNLVFEMAPGALVTGQVLQQSVRVPVTLNLPEGVFRGETIRTDIGFGPVNTRAQFVADPL